MTKEEWIKQFGNQDSKDGGQPLKPYELDELRKKAEPPYTLPLERLASDKPGMSRTQRESLYEVLNDLRERNVLRWPK